MSSVYYFTRLYWSSHQHHGTAKLHGHEMTIDTQPVLCGQHVDCDYTPEVGVGRIKEANGGWRDMDHDEIVDADKLLHDLIPDD